MKIKRIKIQNFRGINELNLDFSSGNIHVLIGINGVGKSSVIECLAILLSSYVKRLRIIFTEQQLQRSPEDYGNSTKFNSSNITINDVHNSSINYYYNSFINNNQISRETRGPADHIRNGFDSSILDILVDYNQESFEWSKVIKKDDSKTVATSAESGLESLVNKIVPSYSPDFSIPLVLCYPVNRAVLDVSLNLSDTSNFTQLQAFDESLTGAQVSFDDFFRWFRSLEDLENEERRDSPGYRDQRLESVRRALPNFLPEFTNLRVRRSPLRMTVFKADKELIVDQLSDGEKCLLAMVSDLARRLAIANPGLSNPLQGNGIILIDEIELHLHPRWQRGILPSLTKTFPNCQFIVSTHSPQIVSDVQPDAIYILQQASQGLTISHPTSSYGRDSNQILEVLMGVPDRPAEIKNRLQELFRYIDNGQLEEARQFKVELEHEIGFDEPEFAKADVMIRRKEILGR
jgi:predicted ATP-binding protein involved in virulence